MLRFGATSDTGCVMLWECLAEMVKWILAGQSNELYRIHIDDILAKMLKQ